MRLLFPALYYSLRKMLNAYGGHGLGQWVSDNCPKQASINIAGHGQGQSSRGRGWQEGTVKSMAGLFQRAVMHKMCSAESKCAVMKGCLCSDKKGHLEIWLEKSFKNWSVAFAIEM